MNHGLSMSWPQSVQAKIHRQAKVHEKEKCNSLNFCSLVQGTVGLYFPTMGMIKSRHVPEDIRATLYNIFRIPLNLIVVVVLSFLGKLASVSLVLDDVLNFQLSSGREIRLCTTWSGSLSA